ncbi:EmrB/QacA subfamily drug resistance transporter [Streptomyces ambofaciens]|uniref:DHA2 family efflux MFS transporter permease subunit n=1 Tax=Streptomyces sp. NPDC048376 TaxID=3154926 RepID=UPI00341EDE46
MAVTDAATPGSVETRGHPGRTAAVTSVAVFMVSLDNLVVTTALPKLRESLDASLAGLEWTVNSFTLVFAVLLLSAAAVADRFGRKRLFAIGIGVFTLGSVLCALAPGIEMLVAGRAVQGVGAAIVLPLTLTLLSAAYPPHQRGAALGIWGAVGGLAVALGPVVGGVVINYLSWQWIFWINVPIGVALLALAPGWLTESRGERKPLDVGGTLLGCVAVLGIVFGLVESSSAGWGSPRVTGALVLGAVALLAFLGWEHRSPAPMLPLRFFRNRGFNAINGVSLLMYFGMFGSIFLVTQYVQTVQGASPLGAGLRLLAWTGMTLIAAPIGGVLSDRIGGRPIVLTGMVLQAAGLVVIALTVTESSGFLTLLPAFVLNGLGMGLYFGPAANLALGAVRRSEEGIASGVNNTIRELGGVFGVAVLSAVFAARGGYESGHAFVTGMRAAVWLGAAAVAVAAVWSLWLAGRAPGSGADTDPGPADADAKSSGGAPTTPDPAAAVPVHSPGPAAQPPVGLRG